ncbi:MAG: hypothetical protein MUC60_02240 [Oscillatoria sp. Prado101]|nr:hypothetical protein [Oscillatoria sp. Prado101]
MSVAFQGPTSAQQKGEPLPVGATPCAQERKAKSRGKNYSFVVIREESLDDNQSS